MEKTNKLSKKDINQVYGGNGKKVPSKAKKRDDTKICPQCGGIIFPHRVCPNCGYSPDDRFD